MKLVIVLCLVALAYANKDAKISNDQFNINKDGSFDSTFDTSNGISAIMNDIYSVRHRRSAYPGSVPTKGNYVRTGSYTYEWGDAKNPITWTADENGFNPW